MSALSDEIRAAVAAAMAEEREHIRAIVREELGRASTAGDPDELWTAERVGHGLGMTTQAVWRAHERGALGVEPVRIGVRSLRWRAGDIRALARGKRVRG